MPGHQNQVAVMMMGIGKTSFGLIIITLNKRLIQFLHLYNIGQQRAVKELPRVTKKTRLTKPAQKIS